MDALQAFPVVIGGVIAIVGGMVAQWATHHFARQREREKILMEKAEKLVNALYAHQKFFLEVPPIFLYGTKRSYPPDTMDEIWALQKLYFPSLKPEMDALSTTVDAMTSHLFEESLKRTENKEEWQKTYDDSNLARLMMAYRGASDSLIQAISRRISQNAR